MCLALSLSYPSCFLLSMMTVFISILLLCHMHSWLAVVAQSAVGWLRKGRSVQRPCKRLKFENFLSQYQDTIVVKQRKEMVTDLVKCYMTT